ncbi:hypothetical protein Ddc_02753 [Ditylenchus destructor]|nr:hypothetical protein Ddc_02753 [Ditylenchus destructor]
MQSLHLFTNSSGNQHKIVESFSSQTIPRTTHRRKANDDANSLFPAMLHQRQASPEANPSSSIESNAYKTEFHQHKIVHLNTRPTQLYYEDTLPINRYNTSQGSGQETQICRARVAVHDIYITYDDFNKAYIDVFFYCNGWCCGVDCCQLNAAFILAVSCVCVVVCLILLNICLRSLTRRVNMHRALRRLHLAPRRRVVRANAQRRKLTSSRADDSQEILTVFGAGTSGSQHRSRNQGFSPPQIIITLDSVSA